MQVVAYLLERGADVEAKDSTLVTPMHCAAAGGSVDCCKLLFTKGAVVSARDDKVRCAMLTRFSSLNTILKQVVQCLHDKSLDVLGEHA